MTAPLPSSYLSPMAGFVNALARLTIRGLDARVRELEAIRRDALELRHALRTAASFRETEAAGYIDRSFLEAP
jgi:hypothetical protein